VTIAATIVYGEEQKIP